MTVFSLTTVFPLLLESAPQGRRRLQSFFPKSVREDDLYFCVCFFEFFVFFFQIF